jgi:hypothetical protein
MISAACDPRCAASQDRIASPLVPLAGSKPRSAMGRATPVHKKSSHLHVVLSDVAVKKAKK